MKQLPTIFTTLLTSVLVFLLISFWQPNAAAPVSAAFAPTATPQPATQDSSACDSSRSVQVSGAAVINVAPDRASIQLGVQSNGVTTTEVEQANSAATLAVINAIREMGVEAKDISTDWYVIEPLYDNYDSLYIKGYRINNVVAVTLRDVSKTSALIATALKAGANQVMNIEFYTSELRKYRDQARDLAMKAAQEKAQALAGAAGAETGCILTITENSSSSYNGWWYGRQNMSQWTQNVIQNVAPSGGAGSAGDEEPISLGMISVRADINASFGLK